MKNALPETFSLQEGFFVFYDVGVMDGRKDSHLIEGVLGFFVGQVSQFYFFEGVYLVVSEALDFVYGGIGSLS